MKINLFLLCKPYVFVVYFLLMICINISFRISFRTKYSCRALILYNSNTRVFSVYFYYKWCGNLKEDVVFSNKIICRWSLNAVSDCGLYNTIPNQSAAGTYVFTACKMSFYLWRQLLIANSVACFSKDLTRFHYIIVKLIQGYNSQIRDASMCQCIWQCCSHKAYISVVQFFISKMI